MKFKIDDKLTPLSEEQYNKFISGELKDTELNETNLLKYENGQNYYLLFSCITIKNKL